jgi:dTDP-4-amino-4,6-dideoxygalactose transaminase
VSTLAIEGGAKAFDRTLAAWPVFAADEIEAAVEVLTSGRVNYWSGGCGREFERRFAQWVGCDFGVAVANGSLGLEFALAALDVGAGDEVIVTARSFVASAGCIRNVGAQPVFADVDRDSQNVTADRIEPLIGPRTKAIVVVHLAGWPARMDAIMALARAHDLRVIEDCAQAHGACLRGEAVGSMGDIGVFSFCRDKIISTAGEGGLCTTSDPELYERVWSYKDHGKDRALVTAPHTGSRFRWLHAGRGTNGRMTEVQAAVGLRQLDKVDGWLAERRANAGRLRERLTDVPALRVPWPSADELHAFYGFYFFVQPERLGGRWTRDRVLEAIVAEGVPCFTGSCPEIYREAVFADHPQAQKRLPNAKELGETSLVLLVHPGISLQDADGMAKAVAKVMAHAAR